MLPRLPKLLFSTLLAAAMLATVACRAADAPRGMYPEGSKNVGIYEVNVRQFSEEGTFDQVTEYLPQIKAMIDALEYWVREFGVDGYRCDVAEEVPTIFWNQARRALNQVDQVFMLP